MIYLIEIKKKLNADRFGKGIQDKIPDFSAKSLRLSRKRVELEEMLRER